VRTVSLLFDQKKKCSPTTTIERAAKTGKHNLFRHLKSKYSDIYRNKFQLSLWPDSDQWDWRNKNLYEKYESNIPLLQHTKHT
jgi:hypothetical protein